jgi:hypothetical protein
VWTLSDAPVPVAVDASADVDVRSTTVVASPPAVPPVQAASARIAWSASAVTVTDA